jgi:hypothetical protein
MSLGDTPVYPSEADSMVEHPAHGWTTKRSLGMDGPTGITLRQEFAKAAMQGYLAKPFAMQIEDVARRSVQAADTLLAELTKK